MNTDILKGKWKQLQGAAKEQWGKLTDDDLERIEGSYEKLAGSLQERYGWKKEQAGRMLDDWLALQKNG